MSQSATAVTIDDPLMTINEAAQYLRLHRDTVGELMANGMLPYVMVGRRRRIRQSDVLAYVNAGG